MPSLFNRNLCCIALLTIASASEAWSTLAPATLDNARILIENSSGTGAPFRKTIMIGRLLPVGTSSHEFHEGLGLPAPSLISDEHNKVVISDFAYGTRQINGEPTENAYLYFTYKIPGSQKVFDFDFNAPFNAEETSGDLEYNIRFTHKRRGVIYGTIRGWEAPQDNDGDLVENTYDIQITFDGDDTQTEDSLSEEILKQQKEAFLENGSLNPEFIHWVILQRFEQIVSPRSSAHDFEPIYARRIHVLSNNKKLTREEMTLTLTTFMHKCPTRTFEIKKVGIRKSDIQVKAVYLYIDNSGREHFGRILLTMGINKNGQICKVDEKRTNNDTPLDLSTGYSIFHYSGKREFIIVN